MLKRWALLSAVFHLAIIGMAFLGLLNYKTDVTKFLSPIPVELVETIEEVSQSPDPTPDLPQKKEIQNPPPKKMDSPPKSEESDPVKPESLLEETISFPHLKSKPKSEKQPQKNLKPKIIEPPKPKPITKPKKKKKKQPPKPRDFESVLKNLVGDTPKTDKKKRGAPSDHLAISELDRVRKQIERVWRLPAGVQGMHDLSVRVKIYMNPDRTVRDVRLVHQNLMATPAYRILAETALQAINKFKYKPLLFSPNKYKIWKEITMEFDPRNIL